MDVLEFDGLAKRLADGANGMGIGYLTQPATRGVRGELEAEFSYSPTACGEPDMYVAVTCSDGEGLVNFSSFTLGYECLESSSHPIDVCHDPHLFAGLFKVFLRHSLEDADAYLHGERGL